jgi:hypothetical protein
MPADGHGNDWSAQWKGGVTGFEPLTNWAVKTTLGWLRAEELPTKNDTVEFVGGAGNTSCIVDAAAEVKTMFLRKEYSETVELKQSLTIFGTLYTWRSGGTIGGFVDGSGAVTRGSLGRVD